MPREDQKVSLDKYSIVPRVLIFAIRGEKILLIRGASNKKNWPNLYNGIGGHVEKGEDILSAARREFYEETGLNLINPRLCMIATIDTNPSTGIGMFVFKSKVSEGEPQASEEGILEWKSSSQLEDLPLVEDLPIIIPIIQNLKENDPIIYSHYEYDANGELHIIFS
jgi:8-oxo-dGTP diphosphatase